MTFQYVKGYLKLLLTHLSKMTHSTILRSRLAPIKRVLRCLAAVSLMHSKDAIIHVKTLSRIDEAVNIHEPSRPNFEAGEAWLARKIQALAACMHI